MLHWHGAAYKLAVSAGEVLVKITACCKENMSLHMASTVARAFAGVWGPQWGPGAKPLVRGSEPPEADDILALWEYICELILTRFTEYCSICE